MSFCFTEKKMFLSHESVQVVVIKGGLICVQRGTCGTVPACVIKNTFPIKENVR